jgi:hypothetical protein
VVADEVIVVVNAGGAQGQAGACGRRPARTIAVL